MAGSVYEAHVMENAPRRRKRVSGISTPEKEILRTGVRRVESSTRKTPTRKRVWIKVFIPVPAVPPAIQSRMRNAVPRRKVPNGRIRVEKIVSVGSAMSSCGHFQKGDYGKDEKELREDDHRTDLIHLVEEDGR